MDLIPILWLLLAGPLWAAIGGYVVPLAYQGGNFSNPQTRVLGILGGFALGPIAVGYLWKVRPAFYRPSWVVGLSIVSVMIVSQIVFRVGDATTGNPSIPVGMWLLLAGPVWAGIGAYVIPNRYRNQGLDDSGSPIAAMLGGFVAGPFALAIFWYDTPKLSRNWTMSLVTLCAWQLYTLFALLDPQNLCVHPSIAPTYLTQQTLNGITVGSIYALMAVGLTLIYSVQGIVSFAHGQFYMLGGYFAYYFLLVGNDFLNGLAPNFLASEEAWMVSIGQVLETAQINPLFAIPVAGVLTFIIGAVFERYLLRPMHLGHVERIHEYAILITFGFGFIVENTVIALAGPFSVSADNYTPVKRVTIGEVGFDGDTVFGPIRLLGDRLVAMIIGIVLIGALFYFLQRTWTGRALRAISEDKQAAAVTGVNPLSMNTFAFGLGTMLAGMAGAALVPVFAFVPWVGAEMAGRAYVIVVLGGLGSVPGALIGGIIVGVIEAFGAGCYSDASKGAAYKEAFALAAFAIVLLVKPTGLFGREEL
jgi:branched-chain amino acid transport system permease protein